MGEINFNKSAAQTAPEAAKPKPISTALTVKKPVFSDYIPGFADMRLPRLNLVQNIGELSETFRPGQVVYKGASVFYDPGDKEGNGRTKPIEVVILGLLPLRYAEKVPGGGRGALVSTLEEVAAQGGTIDWKEWDLKKSEGVVLFETLAEFVLAIRQPEHLPNASREFPFVVDTARYALGIWAMKSSAFNNCCKTAIFPDRSMGCTKEFGYPSYSYLASSRLKPFSNGNKAWVPVFKPHQPISDAFLKFAMETVSGADNPQDSGCAE